MRHGRLVSPAYDCFIFRKGLYSDGIPPFAVGRLGFDVWLVYEAARLGACVIELGGQAACIHQWHDYTHISKELKTRRSLHGRLPEVIENRRLCGNSLLRLLVPVHKLDGQALRLDLGRTFRNLLYGLRRNITWRMKNALLNLGSPPKAEGL